MYIKQIIIQGFKRYLPPPKPHQKEGIILTRTPPPPPNPIL